MIDIKSTDFILSSNEKQFLTIVANNSFQVYPNPTSNFFVVNNTGGENYNITIKNITGAVVYSTINQISESRINVNELGIQSGIYFIVIENLSNSKTEIHKLIVE